MPRAGCAGESSLPAPASGAGVRKLSEASTGSGHPGHRANGVRRGRLPVAVGYPAAAAFDGYRSHPMSVTVQVIAPVAGLVSVKPLGSGEPAGRVS